jgi:hypothetical protein
VPHDRDGKRHEERRQKRNEKERAESPCHDGPRSLELARISEE